MTNKTSLETIRKLVADWDGAATCLYLPRPVVEGGDEKWRILKKNALGALDVLKQPSGVIAETLQDWRFKDFRGRGAAFIERDGKLMTAQLSGRPAALLWAEKQPFVLPLLADLDDENARWVLAIDRRQAQLLLYSDGELDDLSDRFDAPDYRGVEATRSIQDDIFFHASGAARSGRQSGAPVFHALGADQSREREKTDEAYYREVVDALIDVIPAQVREIDLFGDPATAGPFATLLEAKGIDSQSHHIAGDALTAERIAETLAGEPKDEAPLQADVAAAPRIKEALAEGRVATLYCAADHCGHVDGRGNEDMALRDLADEPDAAFLNELALAALGSGADVHVVPRERLPKEAKQAAQLRW